ncbi:hypothetical protein PFISCL1PPCAC_9545, partial [Pristionchus fissidentatus]
SRIDLLTETYNKKVKETADLAQQREDILRLEKNSLEEDYKKSTAENSKASREERERITNEYHAAINAKDKELAELNKEKSSAVDTLHKGYQKDLKDAHDLYNKL